MEALVARTAHKRGPIPTKMGLAKLYDTAAWQQRRALQTEWEKTYNCSGNQSIFLSEGINLTASVAVALGTAV